MNYQLLYSTTLLVSFILTFIFYLYHSRYWNQATHRPLEMIYFLNMTSAIMCIVWVIVDGKSQYMPINYLGNIIEFNCMGFCGYCWLNYCLKFVNIPALKTKVAKVLMALPVLIVMVMIITTPLTHFAFYIDEAGFFKRGTIYSIQQTGYVYLLFSSAICLYYRKRCTTSSERRRLTILSLFPLSPAIFGGVQILLPSGSAPTLQFSILISLILVFVDELDQKITKDSLTQLTNHYEFERILQAKMRSLPLHGTKLYVLMSDLDNFKSINDNYGHQQGDTSLVIVANVLTKVASKHNAICARMSGDEFISLLDTRDPSEALIYKQEVEADLKTACASLPYTLNISMGIAEFDGSMSLMELLNHADAKMYEEKKLHKEMQTTN